ncbi:MAG: response regulator [Williamsia sp.]|nr:response regulator [Williamsia sp.]
MKNVIIADDDPGIQDVLQHILKRWGYEAVIYSNAEPLLNNQFTEPDIFIIDKQLQDADGLDVCRFLKSRDMAPHTPVIIFSASSRVNDQAFAAGADDFLEKPFQIRALLDIIEKHTVRL